MARRGGRPSRPRPAVPRRLQGRLSRRDLAGEAVPDRLRAPVRPASWRRIAEAWFDSIEAALSVTGSGGSAAIVAKDDENFLDRSKTVVMVSTEEVDDRR
ncbi:EthD domain-containing protein [Methylobacterium sp. ID0610]|uniref:EthD domain-containing protein n=1 Tax=Methylobacterium carpenticola TaxID=3344827 RepID=UPI0036CFFD38